MGLWNQLSAVLSRQPHLINSLLIHLTYLTIASIGTFEPQTQPLWIS